MNEKQVTKYTMWVQFGKRQRLVWQVIAQLCLILLDPMSVALQALLPIGFPDKNIGVGCHFLLQDILSTQGSKPGHLHLLHWQADPLPLSHREAVWILDH